MAEKRSAVSRGLLLLASLHRILRVLVLRAGNVPFFPVVVLLRHTSSTGADSKYERLHECLTYCAGFWYFLEPC